MTAPDATLGPALLELRKAVRRYAFGDQEVYALRGVDLVIGAGEMVALMGASGSGKSTLLNVLGCLDRLSDGSYRVAGQDTAALDDDQLAELRRKRFGFVFQRYNLLGQLIARANVETPATYAGLAVGARRERAKGLLERLGLGDRMTHYPHQLSGGQQQRVSIARALMNGGEVIFADEPTGALDSANGREVMNLLMQLNRQGHTIVMATHDAHVAAHAERIVELADGVIVSDRPNLRLQQEVPPDRAEDPPPRLPAEARAPFQSLIEAAKMAALALLAHRLRSGLTLLGIVIGILSVTMMVAVGEAGGRVLSEEFGAFLKLGEIIIYPGKQAGDPFAAHVRTLKYTDVEALRQQDYIQVATPQTYGTTFLRYKSHSANASVTGAAEDYFAFHGLEFDLGARFTREDVVKQAPVVVIDERTRNQFFNGEDPIGKTIYVGSFPCVIVGVLTPRAGFEEPGGRLGVIVPFTTSNARITGRDYLDMVLVHLRPGEIGDAAKQKMIDFLAKRHHAKDVWIENLDGALRSMQAITQTLGLLLAGIGVISLVVGGIGVMNIMLVSVVERAREIGVRRAVGARQSDIRQQFMIEAVVLCLVGAALGVMLTFGLIYVANYFVPPQWSLSLSSSALAAATLCATMTGLVFGYTPARNASKLDPVEALSRD